MPRVTQINPNINPEEFEAIGVGYYPEINFMQGPIVTHAFWKNKNHVYDISWALSNGEEEIVGADPETFELLFYPYARDKNALYSYDDSLCPINKDILRSIDPKSLVYFGGSSDYYRRFDRDSSVRITYLTIHYIASADKIYYQSLDSVDLIEIEGGDVNTFEILGYPYAKDKNSVYYQGKVIPNFSSQGFVVDNVPFAIAHNDFGVVFHDQPLEGIQSTELNILINEIFGEYQLNDSSSRRGAVLLKDQSVVYYLDNNVAILLPLLDSASIEFVHLGMDSLKNIVKDKNGVYYLYNASNRSEWLKYDRDAKKWIRTAEYFKKRIGVKRLSVDSQTVEVIDEEHIKDKNGTYPLDDLKKSAPIIYEPSSTRQYILQKYAERQWNCNFDTP